MRITFSKVILLAILFSQNTYAQDGTIGVASETVTVDFATTTILGAVGPSYSGSVIVDENHKLNLACNKIDTAPTGGIQVLQTPCIKNENGELILEKATFLPYQTLNGSVYFDPPATAVSGVITGEIGSSTISTFNILELAIDNIVLILKNNPPQIFSYPFSYSAPEGISLLRLDGSFTRTTGSFIGDPNAFYKIGLKTLTWSTKVEPKLDISVLPNFTITSSTVTANDKLAVRPNQELTFSYDLEVVGRRVLEDRQASVGLFIDNKLISTQIISLSSFNLDGKLKVNFKSTLSLDDIGRRSIQLTVGQSEDINMTNNYSGEDFFYVACNIEKAVPYFSQSDSAWSALKYGFTQKSIRALGCYTASFSMLMKYYGINKSYTSEEINPATVNFGLKNIGSVKNISSNNQYLGYGPESDVIPKGAVNFARVSYVIECMKSGKSEAECAKIADSKISFIKGINFNQKNYLDGFRKINENLCNGNPVILRVPSISNPTNPKKAHFVLATGMDVDDNGAPQYKTNDPGRVKDFMYKVEDIRGYRLFKQIADPSMIYMSVNNDLYMTITEPDGRKVGFNSLEKLVFDENSNSAYVFPEAIGTFDEPDESVYTSTYTNIDATDGEYRVEIFNHKTLPSSYTFIKNSFDLNGNVNAMSVLTGTIEPGKVVIYKLQHSVLPYNSVVENSTIKIYQASYFDSIRKDKAFIFGKLSLKDNSQIPTLDKEVKISINNDTKTIPLHKFSHQRFSKNHVVYTYAKWGRKDIVFQINTKSGEFILYFDNIDLDDSKPNLSIDLKITFDNLIASTKVTFKNVTRRKHEK